MLQIFELPILKCGDGIDFIVSFEIYSEIQLDLLEQGTQKSHL